MATLSRIPREISVRQSVAPVLSNTFRQGDVSATASPSPGPSPPPYVSGNVENVAGQIEDTKPAGLVESVLFKCKKCEFR